MHKKTSQRLTAAVAALAMLASAAPSVAGEGLSGVKVLTFNTFTGGMTEGVETDVGMFGMNNNLFAKIGDGVELPQFITLYDIDFGNDSISFNWVETEFSKTIVGPTPDGNHDRNYFVFDLPAGKAITQVTFDAAGSKLLDGSAEPTAMVVSRNKIVTDFGGGVDRNLGFAPRFTIVVGDAG